MQESSGVHLPSFANTTVTAPSVRLPHSWPANAVAQASAAGQQHGGAISRRQKRERQVYQAVGWFSPKEVRGWERT